MLTAVRNYILVILGFTRSLVYLTDRYYSSPNVHVSAFLTPACVHTFTLAHPYQTVRLLSVNTGYGCSSKSGVAIGCLKMNLPFYSVSSMNCVGIRLQPSLISECSVFLQK